MTQHFFIAATGTGIGKTLVTSALCHQWRQAGHDCLALKPILSGWDDSSPASIAASDTGQLLQAMAWPLDPPHIARVSPWRLRAPLSPNMAAGQESVILSARKIASYCLHAAKQLPPGGKTLVEGVGGVMAPLNATETTLDLMSGLGWPVILVTGSYLGTLSHTLTACAVLRERGLRLHALVMNASEHAPVMPEGYRETLSNFVTAPLIFLPRLAPGERLWQKVGSELGEKLHA